MENKKYQTATEIAYIHLWYEPLLVLPVSAYTGYGVPQTLTAL